MATYISILHSRTIDPNNYPSRFSKSKGRLPKCSYCFELATNIVLGSLSNMMPFQDVLCENHFQQFEEAYKNNKPIPKKESSPAVDSQTNNQSQTNNLQESVMKKPDLSKKGTKPFSKPSKASADLGVTAWAEKLSKDLFQLLPEAVQRKANQSQPRQHRKRCHLNNRKEIRLP